MKILIVDDHPLIREALRHVLPGLAADIRLYDASDLESGLALADQQPDLDLALLDLTLPGCSGMSALRTFRSAQPLSWRSLRQKRCTVAQAAAKSAP